MTRRRLCLAAFFLFTAPAFGADYPERIRRAIETLQTVCTDIGGKPSSFEGAVVLRDINGDGKPDYVVDLGTASCAGHPEAYCINGFCALEIYTWRGEDDWRPLLTATASDWRTARVNNRPALILTQQGSFCGKPKQKTCTVTYTFADGKMYGRMK